MANTGLKDKLKQLSGSDMYPFHMPGHKRQGISDEDPCFMDITEIEGFDDLHYPKGILKDLEDRFSKMYGGAEVILSVNGSTAGNLACFFAAVRGGGQAVIARNCHKSVYNAATIRECGISYVYPKIEDGLFLGVDIDDIKDVIDNSGEKIDAVFITHPTYEGYLSDISGISKFCHSKGIALICDCAHGAHFGLDKSVPDNPISLGADAAVMSLHKTLPSLTQTACIAVSQNALFSSEEVRRYMHIFESSSPSYVLLSGIEECADRIEDMGQQAFEKYDKALDEIYDELLPLTGIRLLPFEGRDKGKLVFSAAGMDGKKLMDTLRGRFHLECEMWEGRYVLAMTGVCDTKEGLNRLKNALLSINDEIVNKDGNNLSLYADNDIFEDIYKRRHEVCLSMFETERRNKEKVELK
ncbi:MAG: aminotransferase class V-fold PLP-dependent enzyme, partial [Lachnospiraceae bacterium]|nr:aminotransferase class V-fold PLP-dependent enzyme [Lachnospiraceae bacterium]